MALSGPLARRLFPAARRAALSVFCFGISLFSSLRGASAEALAIDRVTVAPKTVNLSNGEKVKGLASLGHLPGESSAVKMSFRTNKKAFLSITLRDESDHPVNRYDLGLKAAGNQEFVWDGRMQAGEPAAVDAVIYRIDARTEENEYAVYDPAKETEGLDLEFPEFTFDPETGSIVYVLSKGARVRLRAGSREGALFSTLFDWQAQEAGRHELVWDGLDASGVDLGHIREVDSSHRVATCADHANLHVQQMQTFVRHIPEETSLDPMSASD